MSEIKIFDISFIVRNAPVVVAFPQKAARKASEFAASVRLEKFKLFNKCKEIFLFLVSLGCGTTSSENCTYFESTNNGGGKIWSRYWARILT